MSIFRKNTCLLLILAFWLPGLASAQESRFATGDEGWRATGDPVSPVPDWFAAGGNPGGWLQTVDASTGGTWGWVAPAPFLGNKCLAYGNFLRFDLTASGTSHNNGQADVTLGSGNLRLVFNTPNDPDATWTHYDIPLREDAGWRVNNLNGAVPTPAQFRTVLSNLTLLQIRGEFLSSATDEGGLDNVVLETDFAFDLDANDSTTPPGSLNFSTDTLCGGESPVADGDALVLAQTRIDSIVVEILNPQDGAAERLSLPGAPPALLVTGSGTGRLTLRNGGAAPAVDFQAALLLIRYADTSITATRALRFVETRVYTFCGETAQALATIPYFPAGSAGADGRLTLCAYDAPADLRAHLGTPIMPDGRWEPPLGGGANQADPKLDSAGTYTYIVESPAHCPADSATLELHIVHPPTLTPDTIICRDSTLTLAVQPPGVFVSWTWSTGQNRPDIDVTEAGVYAVTVSSPGGICSFADSVQVDVVTCSECPVYVPNAFSPDDDGVNDRFAAFSRCTFLHFHLQVFDRWGNQVYASSDPEAGWDGRFRGRELPPGVLVWVLDFDAELLGQPAHRRMSGSVALLR